MSKISSAKDKTVEEYFAYPELRVPLFQREYVWDKEEIEEFWLDLIEENVCFLGSIILKDESYDKNSRTGYLDIVDGQQRTVSLLILLATIARKLLIFAGPRKEIYEHNAERQAEEISNLISKRDRKDLTKILSYKLTLPNPEDEINLKNVLLVRETVPPKGYKNFFNVQKRIEELVDLHLDGYSDTKNKIDELIRLKLHILDIKIIEVLVPTDEDAFMIFEAVNDRGADLGAAELLKNYLFSRTTEQSKVHEEWQKVRKALTAINRRNLDLTGFLRYYWIGKYEHLTKKSLFKGIKSRIKEDQIPPSQILDEISSFRDTLQKIYLDGLDDWSLNFDSNRQGQQRAHEWFNYKKNLNYFPKSIQYLPIYTAIIGKMKDIDLKERPFIDLLLAVEKINFIYSYILQEPTNRIDKLLSGIGRDILESIHDKDTLRSKVQSSTCKIEKFLKETVTRKDVDEFVESLDWNKVTDKSIIYFILINLEYVQGGYSRFLVKDDLTLEHVFPKSIEKKGKLPGWQNIDFTYKKIGHGLGNLTLLAATGPQANGAAGEESFEVKKKNFLLPSPYAINRYFENKENWGEKEILERLEYIKNAVWERWGF